MLRKLEEKDVDYMIEWMHDSRVNCNFKIDFKDITREQALEFIRNSFNERNQHFAIVNDSDEYVGTVSLKNISIQDRNAEYAIVTRSSTQGTGLAYKATMDILQYAFGELGLHKVYLKVLEENSRANRFYEKCGFVYEGTLREQVRIAGKYRNLKCYGFVKG